MRIFLSCLLQKCRGWGMNRFVRDCQSKESFMRKLLAGLFAVFLLMSLGCAATPSMDEGALQLYPGIDAIAGKLIESTDIEKAGKITVADFIGPSGQITHLGRHISDKLSVRLFSSRRFSDMMERRQLKQVLATHKQELSGYFDQRSVNRFGHMIGVDSMVIGKLENLGTVIDLTAKVVHAKTGRILGMADVRILKNDAVRRLISQRETSTLTVSVKPVVSGTVTAGSKSIRLTNGSASFTGLSCGVCQVHISVSTPGYASVTRSVNLQSKNENLNINLESRKYDVSFQIVPPEADLSVDGEKIDVNDQGFARALSLSARQYCYSVSAEGFENRTGRFNPAQKQVIMVDLNARDAFYSLKSEFFKKVQGIDKDFNIRLWASRKECRTGEPIKFYFRTERDCYLNLVDVNSRGELTLLFPNRFHRHNFIRAGRTYQIPDERYDGFEYEIQPPVGTDRIYAIASSSPLDLFDNDFEQSRFMAVTRNGRQDARARGIGIRLKNARLDSAAEYLLRIR